MSDLCPITRTPSECQPDVSLREALRRIVGTKISWHASEDMREIARAALAGPDYDSGAGDHERVAARGRSCNRHVDCDAADERAKATGRRDDHCRADDCEDCFGR